MSQAPTSIIIIIMPALVRLRRIPRIRGYRRLPIPLRQYHSSIEVSDSEWDSRTGRAIIILRDTLPTFFSTGLVTSSEGQTSTLDTIGSLSQTEESIYSPRIRLTYTPPTPLPSPLPHTFHVEGFPLYMSSSVFIRYTLSALYSDLAISLYSLKIYDNRHPSIASSTPPPSSSSPEFEPGVQERQKNVQIGLNVTGINRVSKVEHQWDIVSTYRFSPATGLIAAHIVESIWPAPHQAVWEGVSKVLRLEGAVRPETPLGCAGDGSATKFQNQP